LPLAVNHQTDEQSLGEASLYEVWVLLELTQVDFIRLKDYLLEAELFI
jgi:hypothetical protein